MKNVKRMAALLLCVGLFWFAGCGDSNPSPAPDNEPDERPVTYTLKEHWIGMKDKDLVREMGNGEAQKVETYGKELLISRSYSQRILGTYVTSVAALDEKGKVLSVSHQFQENKETVESLVKQSLIFRGAKEQLEEGLVSGDFKYTVFQPSEGLVELVIEKDLR